MPNIAYISTIGLLIVITSVVRIMRILVAIMHCDVTIRANLLLQTLSSTVMHISDNADLLVDSIKRRQTVVVEFAIINAPRSLSRGIYTALSLFVRKNILVSSNLRSASSPPPIGERDNNSLFHRSLPKMSHIARNKTLHRYSRTRQSRLHKCVRRFDTRTYTCICAHVVPV